jgi:hypothetical protein
MAKRRFQLVNKAKLAGYIKAKWQNRGILMEIKKLKALNSISRILAVLIGVPPPNPKFRTLSIQHQTRK